MEAVVEQAGTGLSAAMSDVLIRMDSAVTGIFGCWHRQLSLPFTRGNETYRTCVNCGARRRFDLDEWTMVGDFYRP
jgi:hypothetical protein